MAPVRRNRPRKDRPIPIPPHRLLFLRIGVLASALAIAGVILAWRAFIVVELRQQIVENADNVLASLSRVTAEQTSQTFLAADILLRSVQDLATKPGVSDREELRSRAQTRLFHESLVRLKGMLPQVDAVGVIDRDGGVLASSRSFPPPEPLTVADSQIFRALRADPDRGLAFTGAVRATQDGPLMIYLARAFKDDSGAFAGAAVVGIKASYFEDSFSLLDEGTNRSVSLIADDGRMIASWPKAATAIGRAPVGHGQAAVAQAGVPRLAQIVGADGETRIVADTGLRAPGVPLHIAVAQDKTSVLKPWRAMLIATIITTTVSLLIIAAIAILLMRWLVWEERWRRALIDHQNHISKQAVDLTVARDHAETAQRTRGQFLANMSHELRTPLNAVIGFSDIFRQELFGPLGSARYIEYANDIHRSGEHLLDIINNILDLTKIDSGRFELATEPVDIAELVRFCCRLVAESVQAGDLSLSMDAPDDLPTVDGDLIRLRQILFNLLSNAIKFTPAGGRIVVTADRAGDMIRLRVADTGIGMTAEEIRLAMQPFYQVDNGITRRYQGTGLGLPLTKSLVDLHDGRMEIESAPKKGTTVSVYLKASQSGQESFERDAAA